MPFVTTLFLLALSLFFLSKIRLHYLTYALIAALLLIFVLFFYIGNLVLSPWLVALPGFIVVIILFILSAHKMVTSIKEDRANPFLGMLFSALAFFSCILYTIGLVDPDTIQELLKSSWTLP